MEGRLSTKGLSCIANSTSVAQIPNTQLKSVYVPITESLKPADDICVLIIAPLYVGSRC